MANIVKKSTAELIKDNRNIMKSLTSNDSVRERAAALLGNEAGIFLASVLDLYNSDNTLAECNASAVVAECMKAAALKLPVSKSLGFAYVVPYRNKDKVAIPQFQLGYKGLVQLAQRSGQYKYLNAGCVYEGETVVTDRLSGMVRFEGAQTSDKVIGYFAYFQLLNGFEKCEYWTRERAENHARQFSKAYKNDQYGTSPWNTQFDAMALKTVIKSLISKYGVVSIEFASAYDTDATVEEKVENEVAENANVEPLTIPATMDETTRDPEPEPATIAAVVPADNGENDEMGF